MKKISIYEDVNAVLNKSKTTLSLIEDEYKKSLDKQEVSDALLVEIKDFLGNLKSSLDYSIKKVSKNNFPYLK